MSKPRRTGRPAAKKSGPRKADPKKGGSRTGSPKKGGSKSSAPKGRGADKRQRTRQRGDSGGGPGGARQRGQRGTTPVRADAGGRRGLGGEQIEGRQAVRELLLAGTRRPVEIVLAGDVDPAPIIDDIIDLADEAKVPVRQVSRGSFESMRRTEAPQGVIATAAPLRPVKLEDLFEPTLAGPPFLLVVDGVTDPGNLGAMLRTAECAGVTGVVLSRHRAANVTPTAAKAAAGAIEHLPMAQVAGIPAAVQAMKDHGIWTVGLDGDAPSSLHELTVADEPVALVLGAEGAGLSRLVRERCDTVVAIPLHGVLASLNVSNAAAVACFEVARLRASS